MYIVAMLGAMLVFGGAFPATMLVLALVFPGPLSSKRQRVSISWQIHSLVPGAGNQLGLCRQ